MASMLSTLNTMTCPKAMSCPVRGVPAIMRTAGSCGCGARCNGRCSQGARAAASAPVARQQGRRAAVVANAAPSTVALEKKSYSEHDLSARHGDVLRSFPTAMGIDDFIARVEVVLSGFGFTGDNSIAMTNLCRDEVTAVMKDKIESVFGSSFNTNGLGAVLTCGATGMGAGLSHSPICPEGRERYVFFSFPHIAIDSQGAIGTLSRPGRAGRSCACGALQKCLNEFTAEGYSGACKVPGVHDPLDPEYSILKQRLARRLRYERADVTTLSLASLTAVAERTITNDLEYLIEKAIDPTKADYAVITGVQIHNWAIELEKGGAPSMEFAAPTTVYVVVNGVKINVDLSKVPAMSPRQLLMMATGGEPGSEPFAVAQGTGSTLSEIPFSYLSQRLGGASVIKASEKSTDLAAYSEKGPKSYWPAWQSELAWQSEVSDLAGAGYDKAMGAANMEENHVFPSFQVTEPAV